MQTIDLLTKHPDMPDYDRKVVIRRTLYYHDENYTVLVVDVQHYKDGVLVNNPQGIVRTLTIELRADNSLLVDEDGNYVFPGEGGYTEEQLETYKGEYEYLNELEKTAQPYSVEQFKEGIILKADSYKRFDR
jgi:hypothetical protein